jgi:hypothetical protein
MKLTINVIELALKFARFGFFSRMPKVEPQCISILNDVFECEI